MEINSNTNQAKKKKYEFFDVTADIGFWAYGSTLEESFSNAGLAMFDIITNVSKIRDIEVRKIAIESEDLVSLLYDWLEELLFIHEVEYLLFSKFEVVKIIKDNTLYRLEANVYGEKINWNIHERGSEVKAVTFHLMELIESNDSYRVQVILDL
jgi:SHS2 domain-containing protein